MPDFLLCFLVITWAVGGTMEADFIVLKYDYRTPILAMCRRCQLKFFTLHILSLDPIGAEQYLWGKYQAHDCKVAEFPSQPWRSRRAV